MGPRLRARVVVTVVAVVAALVVGGAWTEAGAHTEVLRASPSPGERVSGPVEAIELTFLDPVVPDVTIEVFDAAGEPIGDLGPVELSEDRRTASVSVPPLSGPADYVVEYRFTATDGDVQRETYRFTVGSLQEDAEPGGGGGGAGFLVGGAVGALVVLVVLAGAGLAFRRRA